MHTQSLRRRGACVVVAALAVALVVGAGGASSAAPTGHAAKRKTLTLRNTASLHLTRKNGNVIYEKGTATGTLPGTVTARFVTSLTKVTGTVTFKPYSGGSLTVNAVGYPQSASTITRFTGSLAVRKGTGRFRNALGSGTFNGTANRRTWAVTVHATARITY
ncbi:MAG TPA: autotransporter [Conexibacter sp.]|nr:autotransporter [Conexibacter sp.]